MSAREPSDRLPPLTGAHLAALRERAGPLARLLRFPDLGPGV